MLIKATYTQHKQAVFVCSMLPPIENAGVDALHLVMGCGDIGEDTIIRCVTLVKAHTILV